MPETPYPDDAMPVGKVFLSLHNPRHDPVDAEEKAIEKLCSRENVYQLAKDIVKHGLNPLERFAIIPLPSSGSKSHSPSYYCAEGNRRLCAIKILNDPDLAPADQKKNFEKLSVSWDNIKTIPTVIFANDEEVKIWLDRVHNGPQNGVGRKEWNSEQKARFYGSNKNKLAQMILDYAEKERMITPEERKNKLTTCQRFVEKDVFQEVLGLDTSDPDELARNRPKKDFDTILRRFMRDLLSGESVNSRMNKPQIRDYARPLSALPGISTDRIQAEALSEDKSKSEKKERRKAPKKPEKIKFVQNFSEIENALVAYGNEKLKSLYHSICTVDLEMHTPLVSVGTWSFFETLTGCAGRNEGTSLDSYLGKSKLQSYGFTGETNSYTSALKRIREFGNTTKHHPVSATFNGPQLNNDIATLKNVILKCIEEAKIRNP